MTRYSTLKRSRIGPASYDDAKARLREKQGKRPSRYGLKATKSNTRQRKPLRTKIDPKLVAWSRAVKKRDVFCQWPRCPYLGPAVTIDAHHKAPRSQRPDLKYELSNGILLCRFHHEHTHGAGKAEAIALGILVETTYELAQKESRAA